MKKEVVNPFSENAIILFRKNVYQHMVEVLGLDSKEAKDFVDWASSVMSEKKMEAFPIIYEKLKDNKIREIWNKVFYEKRAKYLADWVLPYVKGNMLDLLCGDGRVGEEVQKQGVEVMFVERADAYDAERGNHIKNFVPYKEFTEKVNQEKFGTVLLSAVLHHEPDPKMLLNLADKVASSRFLILENCLEKEYPMDYHLLMDYFFNLGLNHFNTEVPMEHKSLEDWKILLQKYGKVIKTERSNTIPGIPFSYHLIVVDKF